MSVRESLIEVASAHNINLERNRLDHLVETAPLYPLAKDVGRAYPASWDDRGERADDGGGFIVEQSYRQYARVHFAPANGYSKTERILRGIESFQNYFLLCDAGVIMPPSQLFGSTHPRLARASLRLGFDYKSSFNDRQITAPFERAREAAFSERVVSAQGLLQRRIDRNTRIVRF